MASDRDYIKTHQYSNKELEDLQKKNKTLISWQIKN